MSDYTFNLLSIILIKLVNMLHASNIQPIIH